MALLQKHDRVFDILVFEMQDSQVREYSSDLFAFLAENLHGFLELHKQTEALALEKVNFLANLLNHVKKFETLRTALSANHAERIVGTKVIFDCLFIVFGLRPIET